MRHRYTANGLPSESPRVGIHHQVNRPFEQPVIRRATADVDDAGTLELVPEHVEDEIPRRFVKGVEHLAKLDKDNALLLVRTEDGALNLETVPLP